MTTPRQDFGFDGQKYIEERSSKTGEVKKYLKGKFLGKGGFAKCYEFTVVDTKQTVASKVIPKASLTKSRAKQKLMSEIKIHRSLNQQNIVGFIHFFEDYENVYILLELCTNQTMNELIRRRKRLTELEVQCYMVQILNSVKHLHKHRVIHRDLKLGNLFLSDKMEIKLGDFGLATKLEFEEERKRTICGTPNYIAPEILEGSKKGHSYEVDVWSIGVIMYTLLIGKPPFETNDVKTTYRRIKMNAYSFPEHVIISQPAKDLVTRILQTDPHKRPSIDDILNHEFFNRGGSIPKNLPVSTLACPPSASYVRQFLPNQYKDSSINNNVRNSPTKKLESTAPISVGQNPNPYLKERKDFINTDRTGKAIVNNFDMNNINNQKYQNTQNILQQQKNSALAENNSQNNKQHTQTTENLNSVRNSLDKYTYLKSNTSNNNKQYNSNSNNLGSQINLKTEVNLQKPSSSLISTNNNTNLPTQPSSSSNIHFNPSSNNNIGITSEIWVKKWVDYSSKYGLGYLLSTGQAGAFFNDSTKIILDKDGKKFEYIERKGSEREDIVSSYQINEYPKELQKKITLLQHFKNYLEGEKTQNKENEITGADTQNPEISNNTEQQLSSNKISKNIYVKKWLKTKHAIMFRLSNKVVQVIFQDQTEIILSSELKIVTYVNKKHERLTFPLANALESSNQEMAKRLKYTKDILTHMLGNQGQQQQNNNNTNENNNNKQQQSNNNNNIRTNKHASSSQSNIQQNNNQNIQNFASSLGTGSNNNNQNNKNINKYTPSVDSNKQQYASNPTYGSIGKSSKVNTYQDENEINTQNQAQRLQKQSSSHGFNLTGSIGLNGNNNNINQQINNNNNNSSNNNNVKGNFDNIQLLKSQSTAGRMSVLNPQTNNFMSGSSNQRKTELI